MEKNLLVQEALERMKALKLMPRVCNEFKKDKIVYFSERQNKVFDGILYYAHQNEEINKIIKDFEQKHECLVYHAQLTHTSFGTVLSLLYVSNTTSEWDMDKQDIANGETLAYVYNMDDPDLSEFGYIGVAPKNGGIARTW